MIDGSEPLLLKKKNQKYGKSTEVTVSLLTVQPTQPSRSKMGKYRTLKEQTAARIGDEKGQKRAPMLNHKGHFAFVVNPKTDLRFLIVTGSQGGMAIKEHLTLLKYLLLMIQKSGEIPRGKAYIYSALTKAADTG